MAIYYTEYTIEQDNQHKKTNQQGHTIMQIHLDDEQLLCLQVCLQNAPTPYDIAKKDIKNSVVDMVGEPPKIEVEPLLLPKYDLTRFGIHD